jgi:hypothetical protein
MRATTSTFPIALMLTLLSAASAAAPTRPAAPQVTVGADLKQLIFDWSPVAGATHYRLLENPDGHSGFRQVGANILPPLTRARLSISVHLQRWSSARYIVSACNTAGCTDSASIFPQNLMLDTIGYFKDFNTNPGDRFGRTVVLSQDGKTLAVAAEGENSNAGAVHVFRLVGGRWRLDVYLTTATNQAGTFFGSGFPLDQRALAISGDGSILAIGAPGEDVSGIINAGTVYVYRRCPDNRWRLIATLRPPVLQATDFFGFSVDLSVDGHTLKVNSVQPQDLEGNPEARTHIYVLAAGAWRRTVTLAPFHAGDQCSDVRLSGDGRTLVQYCRPATSSLSARAVTLKRSGENWIHASDLAVTPSGRQPLALNFDATLMALAGSPGGIPPERIVSVYRWNGTSWQREVDIRAPELTGTWGEALAFNRDGRFLAIGDATSTQQGAGVSDTVMVGGRPHGAVFLYQRNATTARWSFRSVIKASNPGIDDLYGFVTGVALSGNGRTLAVGAIFEDSAARGIDGNQADESASQAGAVYLY